MDVRDEQEWIAFQQHVRDKGNAGMRKLLELFVDWSEAVQGANSILDYNHLLEDVEGFSFLSAGDLAELLWMACHFWPNGTELAECLTPLERRMVYENVVAKQLAQAEQARKAGERANTGRDASR